MSNTLINPWLSKVRKRRVEKDLSSLYLRRHYRDVARVLAANSSGHPDWQSNFVVFVWVDGKNEIEKLEVRED